MNAEPTAVRAQDMAGELQASVCAEIEALKGTADKVRAGSSGDKVAAWIEMSVRGLEEALATLPPSDAEVESFEAMTARNQRVQRRYDQLRDVGEHGHYETMFQVVREELATLRASPAPVDGWRELDDSYVPEDRKPVLVSWTHPDGQRIVGEAEWRESGDEFYRGWWWANTGMEYEDVICPAPTHVRPLPSPPSVPESDEVAF